MRSVVVLLALVLLVGCQDDESGPAALPDPVSTTRAGILSAAQERDYDALGALIEPELFISEYSSDPVAAWRKLGDKPLETMEVLLQMRHQVRETNEGTLYQWPRFGPDSKPGDMSEDERRALRKVMSEAELRDAILPEVGYTSPRLGILADGRWWFLVLRGGP
jgi:hypothetical protein